MLILFSITVKLKLVRLWPDLELHLFWDGDSTTLEQITMKIIKQAFRGIFGICDIRVKRQTVRHPW